MSERSDQSVRELLAGDVLGDLSVAEREELYRRLNNAEQSGPLNDLRDELEASAAALQAIGVTPDVDMPASLSDSIRQRGYGSLATLSYQGDRSKPIDGPIVSRKSEVDVRVHRREWVAWALLAASLLWGIGLWAATKFDMQSNSSIDLAELRLNLGRKPGSVRAAWSAGKTPFENAIIGDVIWDPQSQTGVMKFVGMPVNDPAKEQYQLWIVDPRRDDAPVDGGVFNIKSSGEVLIPIDAKLDVLNPEAFAITIEKPGGVVVSTQERLPLLAVVEH